MSKLKNYSLTGANDIPTWNSSLFTNSGIKWNGSAWVAMPSGGSGYIDGITELSQDGSPQLGGNLDGSDSFGIYDIPFISSSKFCALKQQADMTVFSSNGGYYVNDGTDSMKVTSSTPCADSAIIYALSNLPSKTNRVLYLEGNFLISSAIGMQSDTKILLNGSIRLSSNVDDNMWIADNKHNFEICGGTYYGNKSGQSAGTSSIIRVLRSTRFSLHDLKLFNAYDQSIDIVGYDGNKSEDGLLYNIHSSGSGRASVYIGYSAQRIAISNFLFESANGGAGADQDGICIGDASNNHIAISNGICNNNARHGIGIWRASGLTINNVICQNNGGCGFKVTDNCKDIYINGIARGNTDYGFNVESNTGDEGICDNIVLRGISKNNDKHGVRIWAATAGTNIGNVDCDLTVAENGYWGYNLTTTAADYIDHPVIKGVVKNNSQAGAGTYGGVYMNHVSGAILDAQIYDNQGSATQTTDSTVDAGTWTDRSDAVTSQKVMYDMFVYKDGNNIYAYDRDGMAHNGTDAYTVIQAAIKSMPSSSCGRFNCSGRLYIDKGTYYISSTIFIPSSSGDLLIEGATKGKTGGDVESSFIGGTHLVASKKITKGDPVLSLIEVSANHSQMSLTGGEFRNLHINGNLSGTCLHLPDADTIEIDSCTFCNSVSGGVYDLVYGYSSNNCKWVPGRYYFTNCEFSEQYGRDTLHLDRCVENSIINCVFANQAARHHIYISDTQTNYIAGNQIGPANDYNNAPTTGACIRIDGSAGYTSMYNTIVGNILGGHTTKQNNYGIHFGAYTNRNTVIGNVFVPPQYFSKHVYGPLSMSGDNKVFGNAKDETWYGYDYIIYKDGSDYKARLSRNGMVTHQNTDGATLIQNVLDAVSGQTGQVIFKSGAYNISSSIYQYSDTTVNGANFGSTKFIAKLTSSPMWYMYGKNTSLSNLSIEGQGLNSYGIDVSGCTNARVNNIKLFQITGGGFSRGINVHNGYKNTISNISIDTVEAIGINFKDETESTIYNINSKNVFGNPSDVIRLTHDVSGCINCTVENVRVRELNTLGTNTGTYRGIGLFKASSCNINNCIINGTYDYSYWCESSQSIIFNNCQGHRCTNTGGGICFKDSDYCQINGGSFNYNVYDGVIIGGHQNNAGETCRGIIINGVIANNNNQGDSSRCGIRIINDSGKSQDCNISNCVCYDDQGTNTQYDGISTVNSTGRNLVSCCRCSGNTNSDFNLHASDVSGNTNMSG